MKILFLNHDGSGFANHIEIEAGTTVTIRKTPQPTKFVGCFFGAESA
jgi:hypothetical protein